MKKILFVHSGANHPDSVSREIASNLQGKMQGNIQTKADSIEVRLLDLERADLPLVDGQLLGAFFGTDDSLSAVQQQQLAISERYISDLQWADELVISAPMYNFSVPARLKAWIDLVCRAGLTFEYTENGPRGLLAISKAYFIVATGGTPIGSDMDFSSGYLKQIAGFLGIESSHVIHADGSKRKRDEIIERANSQIDQLLSS